MHILAVSWLPTDPTRLQHVWFCFSNDSILELCMFVLVGVYSGDTTDDFVFKNNSMLEPADPTDREIYEWGETCKFTV